MTQLSESAIAQEDLEDMDDQDMDHQDMDHQDMDHIARGQLHQHTSALPKNRAGGCGGRPAVGRRRQRLLLTPVLAAALALTGCATTISGTPAPAASPTVQAPKVVTSGETSAPSMDSPTSNSAEPSRTSAPSSGSSDSQPAAVSIDPAAFSAKMQAANAGIKTMRGSISVTAGPLSEEGTFSETLSGGKASAIDMALFIKTNGQSIPLKVLIVDDKVYLGGSEMLSALNAGGKKWALASASSGNTTLRTLATTMQGVLESASANQYQLFAEAAKSISDEGASKLGQVDAHKYVITVDVAKLSTLLTGTTKKSMEAVLAGGLETIPSTIWLDGSGRVVQTTTKVTAGDITSDTLFKVIAYNTPVVIKAPADTDVYTG